MRIETVASYSKAPIHSIEEAQHYLKSKYEIYITKEQLKKVLELRDKQAKVTQ